jgi:hypothetical protein
VIEISSFPVAFPQVGASIDWGVLAVFTCADSCDIPLSGKEATAEQQTSPEFAYKREFLGEFHDRADGK